MAGEDTAVLSSAVARGLQVQQVLEGDRVVALRRRRLRVEVVRGPDRKLRRALDDDRIVIGSHPDCDVALTDLAVSRQHCELAVVEGGWAIRDLDSTNGTWIDALRVREVVITDEVKLRLGETVLRIGPDDEVVDLPVASEPEFGPLRGRSPAMRRIFHLLARVAGSDATVLIDGEPGTGKELAARAIHEASARARGPFVVVDCATRPAVLLESALYGHRRGAFAGALGDRAGAFVAAAGGTVLLDDIDALPLDLQVGLLTVLERNVVVPLGSTTRRSIDVRVIAATSRDLRRDINRGGFREDLYFRLAVVPIHLPPLRDRPEDILVYIDDLARAAARAGRPFTIDPDTLAHLSRQPWRGNVGELRDTLERATRGPAAAPAPVVVARGPDDDAVTTLASMVGAPVDLSVPFRIARAQLVDGWERAYVQRLMAAHDGDVDRAARGAEVDRLYLLRLLDQLGLRPRR